jgi:hypothetical protein
MLSADLGYLTVGWWEPIPPAIAIMFVVGALNLVADGIRDAAHLGRTGRLDDVIDPVVTKPESENADAA